MLPWVHLYVNTQGKATPCCFFPWDEKSQLGDINQQRIAEIWNDRPMRRLRASMLRDQRVDGCWQCYTNEKFGLRSKRQISNELFKHRFDWVRATDVSGNSPDSKPVYWDIRISNLCNFKCRICGHHSSSKLFDEAVELGTTSFAERVHQSISDMPDFYRQIMPLVDSVEEIYFAGGEPLIMDEHYRILDLLLERGRTDVRLSYSTNLSELTFRGRDVMDLWSGFSDVTVHASLDGWGARGEYQRKGQRWNEVLMNRQRLRERCPGIRFIVTPTITVFNVQHLPEFHRALVAHGLIRVDEMLPRILKHPDIYNIRILPESVKRSVEASFREHLDWLDTFDVVAHGRLPAVRNEFRQCLEYLRSADRSDLIPKFRASCERLDRMRKESTLEIFPELAPLLL
ncbi:MAG: twitch domain-containing radical SAM protein [Chromatiales bacterium]|nr:twitch domain-containing radical SAM protein [Chromatiales bacterium]